MIAYVTHIQSLMGLLIGLVVLSLFSCRNSSFDKQIAINQFTKLKPACEIVATRVYDCDGTFGECVYLELKYKCHNQHTISDTTVQYWYVNDNWKTVNERHFK